MRLSRSRPNWSEAALHRSAWVDHLVRVRVASGCDWRLPPRPDCLTRGAEALSHIPVHPGTPLHLGERTEIAAKPLRDHHGRQRWLRAIVAPIRVAYPLACRAALAARVARRPHFR